MTVEQHEKAKSSVFIGISLITKLKYEILIVIWFYCSDNFMPTRCSYCFKTSSLKLFFPKSFSLCSLTNAYSSSIFNVIDVFISSTFHLVFNNIWNASIRCIYQNYQKKAKITKKSWTNIEIMRLTKNNIDVIVNVVPLEIIN